MGGWTEGLKVDERFKEMFIDRRMVRRLKDGCMRDNWMNTLMDGRIYGWMD